MDLARDKIACFVLIKEIVDRAASTMEKLNFKVGQLAEMRTFSVGFRGAWFRCKINGIHPEKNKLLLEYYDFDEEAESWEEIYQRPRYGKRSRHQKKQLMVRPQYPTLYFKSERPPVNSILQQPCIVIDGSWKVGDKVDWKADDCYWSATVIKLLSDDKVQIELPAPPSGQGGRHEAFCSDLRPSLDWSETEGWSFPTLKGRISCNAHLILPTNQGMGLEVEHAATTTAAAAAASPVNASSTTRISVEEKGEGDRDSAQNVKTDGNLMESSESSSSLHVKKRKVAAAVDEEIEKRELNVMCEHTLEAALLDLEELINKVNWMQRILRSPTNDATTSSWNFA